MRKDYHRTVIGPKGAKLKEIEIVTNTKIQVPRISDQSDLITITGPKDGIEKAIQEINRIVNEQLNRLTEVVMIKKTYHPFITGANNKHLNALMNETAAKINVPPFHVDKNDIIIVGHRDGVLVAKNRILEAFGNLEASYVLINWDVPKTQHKYICGKLKTIRQKLSFYFVQKSILIVTDFIDRNFSNELMDDYSTILEVPPIDSDSPTLQVRGPVDGVGEAIKRIFRRAHSMKKIEIESPGHFHKYLMGPKASNMQYFKDNFPRTNIKFLKMDDRVEIEGPIEEVAAVEAQLFEWMNDIAYEKIVFDAKFITRIIGRSRFNLNNVKSQFNVMVSIVDEDENTKSLAVVGKKEGVDCAVNEIVSYLKQLENEDDIKVPIEQKHHGAIIGTKGKNVRDLRDKYPSVSGTFFF